MKTSAINVILFDIGGVLVEFSGIHRISEWTHHAWTKKELWRKWLSSPAVRNFETGKSSAQEFSEAVIKEFDLPTVPEEFLQEFGSWLKEKYPGVDDLLSDLSETFKLACFSNTNEIHWPKIKNDLGLGVLLHEHYVSHEIGMIKPDEDAFRYVIHRLGCAPESILFFDDNTINVEAALKLGIKARAVSCFDDMRNILENENILK